MTWGSTTAPGNPDDESAAFGIYKAGKWNTFDSCYATGPNGAYGIAFFSIETGEVSNNKVSKCFACNKSRYGIIFYVSDQPTAEANPILDNSILGCTVDNISGDYESFTFPGVKPYGSGIYLQSARGTTVSDNNVSRTNLFTDHSDQLPPGGITLNGVDAAYLSNNHVFDCKRHGISVVNTGDTGADDRSVTIVGGSCRGNFDYGIRVVRQHRVTIDTVGISNNGAGGVQCFGNAGAYNKSFVLKGCVFDGHAVCDLHLGFCSIPIISNNTFAGPSSNGIRINAEVQAALVAGNTFYASLGVLCDSPGSLITGNVFVGCATAVTNNGGSLVTNNRYEANVTDYSGIDSPYPVTTHGPVLASGNFEALGLGSGFILKSPDGTRYKVKVANGGALSTAPA